MSSKVNAACKAVAPRNKKNTVETSRQPSSASAVPQEGLRLFDNCGALIEVTIQTKGRKHASTMVSNSPAGRKVTEEKKKTGSSGESRRNWGKILGEQNRPAIKHSLQKLAMNSQPSKGSKHGTESKDSKKNLPVHQKHELSNKYFDEIPVKQTVSQRRMEEHSKGTARTTNPSTISIPSSTESILVHDRAVQCGGIFECPDDRFGVFNPVRTLGFLMKELEHFVKDDRASKILTDMEQVLFRIPAEPEKLTSADLEAIALRTKLEAGTSQLEETSRKMHAMYEMLREERDSLQRQVQKQAVLLNESRQRQSGLETSLEKLKRELEDARRIREKTVTEFKEEIKGYEFSQKVIADLRGNLSEQTELARQRHLEVQYLTLEKDKLSVLSSYKDTMLIELRNALKELQNHIAEQLMGSKDIYVREESSNPQASLIHGGRACSSPTSLSSRESNEQSWQDISDVSLSAVEHDLCEDKRMKKCLSKPKPFSEGNRENFEKKETKTGKESKTRDSGHLEFISLPAGESSHTILLPPYKDLGSTKFDQIVNEGTVDVVSLNSKKNNGNMAQSKINDIKGTEKTEEKQVAHRNSPKLRKSTALNEKQSSMKKSSSNTVGDSKMLKNKLPSNTIGASITEQFENMFQDIRLQSRMPVSVPSPPRNFPHPDWTDSTLPSISAASELNVIGRYVDL